MNERERERDGSMVFRVDGCSESPALRRSHVNFTYSIYFWLILLRKTTTGDLPHNYKIINVLPRSNFIKPWMGDSVIINPYIMILQNEEIKKNKKRCLYMYI